MDPRFRWAILVPGSLLFFKGCLLALRTWRPPNCAILFIWGKESTFANGHGIFHDYCRNNASVKLSVTRFAQFSILLPFSSPCSFLELQNYIYTAAAFRFLHYPRPLDRVTCASWRALISVLPTGPDLQAVSVCCRTVCNPDATSSIDCSLLSVPGPVKSASSLSTRPSFDLFWKTLAWTLVGQSCSPWPLLSP